MSCHMGVVWLQNNVIKCQIEQGGGLKLAKKSVTYYLNCPLTLIWIYPYWWDNHMKLFVCCFQGMLNQSHKVQGLCKFWSILGSHCNWLYFHSYCKVQLSSLTNFHLSNGLDTKISFHYMEIKNKQTLKQQLITFTL